MMRRKGDMNQPHVTDLLAALALDALEPEEAGAVRRHLTGCEECRRAFEGHLETASLLAEAVTPVTPPEFTRRSIIERVQASSKQSRARRKWIPMIPGGWLKGISPTWGLASLVVIAGLLISTVLLWRALGQAVQREGQVEQQVAALAQTNAFFRVVPLTGTEAGTQASAVLVITHDGASGTLIINDLPALDPGQQYQLWLIKSGQRTSGGVFSVGSEGYEVLEIDHAPASLLGYTSFGVTIEPAGGSAGPTGKKVLGGGL